MKSKKKNLIILSLALLIFLTLLLFEVFYPDESRGMHLVNMYLYIGCIVSLILGLIVIAFRKTPEND